MPSITQLSDINLTAKVYSSDLQVSKTSGFGAISRPSNKS